MDKLKKSMANCTTVHHSSYMLGENLSYLIKSFSRFKSDIAETTLAIPLGI